jgi:hypothetical protein
MTKLGATQLSLLRFMADPRRGTWYAGCGWMLGNPSTTVRILESLARRGLVADISDEKTWTSGGAQYTIRRRQFKITDAGRQSVKERAS